ncbi:MAG: phosphoribosylanthranilate isomerase, partial [Sphingomonadaceae bacterium]
KTKICGLTTPEAVDAAAPADAVGFLFVAASPRAVTPALARPLVARARPLAVGVFADAEDALIAAAIEAGVKVLQLHGRETPARVADVKARFRLPVWKGVGVATAEDVREALAAYPMADRLLLDAKPPPGAAVGGGHGRRFDWAILAEARPARPWILAGGITPETLADAVRATGADFVDVSSGVEDAPGVKSLAKLEAFLNEAARV